MVKNLPANEGDIGSIPGLGRSSGEGNGNLLQYSCLENPMDRGAWWATVHGATRVEHDLVTKPNHKFPNGLPWWLGGKESTCQCRRHGFNPWVGKIPWRRNSNPLQYSCLEYPMDRGAWPATVHGVTKSQTQLRDFSLNILWHCPSLGLE